MTTLSRWKLACALFAGIAGVATVRAHKGPRDVPAAMAEPPRDDPAGAAPADPRRPAAIGVSQREIVDRLFAAKTLKDVTMLCREARRGRRRRGDRHAPAAARRHPRGVPEALLGAFGQIGTKHAVEVLVEHSTDDRPTVRNAAIGGLGFSQSEAGEKVLLAIADKAGDPAQSTAISALGTLASEHAVPALIELAGESDFTVARPRSTRSATVGAVGPAWRCAS